MTSELVKSSPFLRMSNHEYHSREAVSRSFLWRLLSTTPYHAIYDKTHRTEPTTAMRLGTAAHLAVLEPHEFKKQVVVTGVSRRSKSGKAILESYEDNDLIVLSQNEHEQILGMRDAIFRHPTAQHCFAGGQAEASLFAVDPRTGVPFKARYDYVLCNNVFTDLKTTDDASPKAFYYHALKLGYHVQAAQYLRVAKLNGIDSEGFVFVAVEKNPPYAVACYHADEDFIHKGNVALDKALDVYCECKETGVWPGYPDTLLPITMFK